MKMEMPHCFSSRPSFIKRHKEGVNFKSTGHWRSPGHKSAANAVKDFLLYKGFVEPFVKDTLQTETIK